MGKIKLGNGLNIENVMFGSTQIQKVYMGTTLIFPDCSLDVIGWDNSSNTWKPIQLWHGESSLDLYHNGIGTYPNIGDMIVTGINPTTPFNSNTFYWYEMNQGYYYLTNTSGVITDKSFVY